MLKTMPLSIIVPHAPPQFLRKIWSFAFHSHSFYFEAFESVFLSGDRTLLLSPCHCTVFVAFFKKLQQCNMLLLLYNAAVLTAMYASAKTLSFLYNRK